MNRAAIRKFSLLLIAAAVALLAMRDGDGVVPSDRLIPLEGVAVLIVYESGDLGNYMQGQRDIIRQADWTDLVPSGNYRILDKDASPPSESVFRKAFDRPRESLPWGVVSGKKQYEGPLPSSVEEWASIVGGAI